MSNPVLTRLFQIDKTHSEAAFQVRHLLTKVRGRFRDFTGAIDFDDEHPERSTVAFTVQAASLDTGTPDRDAHLRSDDFFAVEKYPTITFASSEIRPLGNNLYDVAGNLTMRGVTRPIVIPVSYLGKAVDPWGNEKLAFEGEVTLNRKDYGLNWNAALETGGFLVGDEVKVIVSVQAAAAK
ncbi:MAG: YceI family protein [Acidobacteria bacterium]|nr:YceI family protein [Acidobacteriota bacterium]